MQNKKEHISVMLNEVLKYLEPKDGCTIIDGTFGAGGYTEAILNSCNCKVIGIDRDNNVLKFVDNIKKKYNDRFEFYNLKFSEIKNIVDKNSIDGLVLDLGVSSMQLDNKERGFSFNKEAPLKMTMGRNNLTAYDIVNGYEEKNIADIIYNFGEEVKSKVIAKKIMDYRKNKTIETTTELADIVRSCFLKQKKEKIDFATKTFQALRIFVNDELNELKTILNDSIDLLKPKGRLVVVSFHSLEDRIVKNFFNENGDTKIGKINKYKDNQIKTTFNILTKKPIIVSEDEVNNNRRSRSAKLRSAIKC